MRVVGIDGCKGGWVAVVYDTGAATLSVRVHPSFAALVNAYPDATAIGVDIPIGLNKQQPRACDLAARKAIPSRSSSVFPAPDRRFLEKLTGLEAPDLDYGAALSLARKLTGKGISQQLFNICPKVAEVDRFMTPALQTRIAEVHPEVSFSAIAGRQLCYPKKRGEGFEERRALLQSALGISIWEREEARALARPATPDDVLDATVAAWTARRVAEGIAERLPPDPPIDARGLRMEIVY
jgi:predicted RNase H-like nuclease